MRCEVRIFGGLPLTCEFGVAPAEPDVGILSAYIDDPVLYDRNGRHASWAEGNMTEDDWDDVRCQCWDYFIDLKKGGV